MTAINGKDGVQIFQAGIAKSALDTDGTLAANNDTKVPSQKAVKTYVGTVSPSSGAKILTAQAESSLSAEVNLGALTSGMLKHTVAAGVSTPVTASPGSDYVSPTGTELLTNKTLSPALAKGPAIISSGFAGTVGSSGTTVTFSEAADALLAGYHATSPIFGTTLIAGAQTRYIVSWSGPTTCVVGTEPSPAWSATAITSVQLPIATFVNSSGVVTGWVNAAGVLYQVGNVGIGTTSLITQLHVYGVSDSQLTIDGPVASNVGLFLASAGVNKWEVYKGGSDDLKIYSHGAGIDVLTIKSTSGNVGIGTTAPIFKNDVDGSIYARKRQGRILFDDAPVGTQVVLSPSGIALLAVPGGTGYLAANVTIQAAGAQLTTSALDDDSASIIMALPVLNTTQNPKFSFRFKVDSIANAAVLVGLTAGAFVDKAAPNNNCALIGIDADNGHTFGAARLVLLTRDDGAAADYDDLGSNMANNTWVWGVVDLTDTEQPRIWIAGTEIAAASITGTVKDATAFYLYFMVQNLAAGAHTLTAVCDHWSQDQSS